MALTRRTARFGELASQIEERLEDLGMTMGSSAVDDLLRDRISSVAEYKGIADRTALRYAPDDLPESIAKAVFLAVRAGEASTTKPKRHLRSV